MRILDPLSLCAWEAYFNAQYNNCVDDQYAFGFTRRVFSSFVVMTPDALERLRTPAFEVQVSRGKGLIMRTLLLGGGALLK